MEQSYKEKYEDILARLAKAKNDNDVCDERFCCVIDDLIPELAESEDEKVRKELIDAIQGLWDNDALPMPLSVKRKDKWLAWLEKQGQVKESTISQHENRTCEENGNSLTYEDERIRKEIINYFQCQSEEEPTRKEIHNKWIAWLENIPYTIDHEKREGFHLGYKACHVEQGEQNLAENAKPQSSTPMSYGKELEKRMCEACNRFYAPNTDSNRYSASDLFYAGVKAERDLNTLAWSEEDEKIINGLIDSLTRISLNTRTDSTSPNYSFYREIDWLRSLKSRVKPKQEWSEDDEQHIDSLLKRLDALCRNKFERTRFAISEDRDWLKSLKDRVQPQPKQEWSEEDKIMMLRAVDIDFKTRCEEIDVDEMVYEAGATSRVTQYWYARGVNDVIKKLKEA